MKLKISLILLLFFLLVFSCIEPFDFNITGDGSKSLVIDGLVTNEPGPYIVYLTKTSDYCEVDNFSPEKVDSAIIVISDNVGNSDTLTETRSGVYETKPEGIQGIQDRFYKIMIETSDGKQYESKPEFLRGVPEIDSIYYEFREMRSIDGTRDNRINVYIDTSIPENEGNYFIWCCTSEKNTDIIIADDRYVNGNKIEKKQVLSIPANNKDSFDGLYVTIAQFSLTKKAYDYYYSINQQKKMAGTIFEPPPAIIKGNIQNIHDPKDHVFGYFGASAITRASIYIPKSAIP
ncbi:MAG: DUF4249 domain-containing protein [Bacteroidetes bacterium]|nr:DUF4249 domain-containing protein [Bacteroidota bacterium]